MYTINIDTNTPGLELLKAAAAKALAEQRAGNVGFLLADPANARVTVDEDATKVVVTAFKAFLDTARAENPGVDIRCPLRIPGVPLTVDGVVDAQPALAGGPQGPSGNGQGQAGGPPPEVIAKALAAVTKLETGLAEQGKAFVLTPEEVGIVVMCVGAALRS